MKKFFYFGVLCVSLFSVIADIHAGSCFVKKNSLCFNFGSGVSDGQGMCSKQIDSNYSYSSCPSAEIAGKCMTSLNGQSIETVFYFPTWTQNLIKERCSKMKGNFTP